MAKISAKRVLARVFQTGRSQAVRLPKEFRVKSPEVYLKKVEEGFVVMEKDPWEVNNSTTANPGWLFCCCNFCANEICAKQIITTEINFIFSLIKFLLNYINAKLRTLFEFNCRHLVIYNNCINFYL